MTLGDRIKRARLARGLSLERLAELMGGRSRQLVWQWEKGESDPRKHIGALSRVLDYPPEYFHGAGEARPDSLEAKIRRLTDANRDIIETTVDAMLAAQAPVRRSRSVK